MTWFEIQAIWLISSSNDFRFSCFEIHKEFKSHSARGSTPTSGRAVQQKVEGRFNHGMNFFDWCHPQWWENIALLDAAAASMTGCAQSTFTSLIPTSCGAMPLGCLPAMFFLDPRPLNMLEEGLCVLAWVLVDDIVLESRTLQELEPGRACKQAGPALRNFAGEHSHRLQPVLPFFERFLWRGVSNMGPYALLAAGPRGHGQLCNGSCISFCACRQQRATTTQCSCTTWPHSL